MDELSWEKYWDNYRNEKTESKDDLFYQVGKTINKEPISDAIFERLLDNIIQTLDLNKSDNLLEMCCGNGIVTKPLSLFCKNIYAFDFTNHLINTAKGNSFATNIVYKIGDAKESFLNLFDFQEKPNKLLMCFSLGYFTTDDLSKMIEYLNDNLDSYLFYITDIPNDNLKWNFYNTDERKEFYYSLIKKGDLSNNGMGKWWNYDEINTIAANHSLTCEIEKQTEIYDYRMNVLFTKEIAK